MVQDVDYEFTEDERDEALMKLSLSALKYDKSHPAAMSLDGFNAKHLSPGTQIDVHLLLQKYIHI